MSPNSLLKILIIFLVGCIIGGGFVWVLLKTNFTAHNTPPETNNNPPATEIIKITGKIGCQLPCSPEKMCTADCRATLYADNGEVYQLRTTTTQTTVPNLLSYQGTVELTGRLIPTQTEPGYTGILEVSKVQPMYDLFK